MLLADGTVQSLQFAPTGKQPPTSVLLQNAIAPPLPVSAKSFTWQTSVPSITPGGTKLLAVPGATSPGTLAVGSPGGVPHLYLLDAAQHRVLDLKVLSGGGLVTPTVSITPTPTNAGGQAVGSVPPVTLQLQAQYASPSLLVQPRSIAVDVLGLQVSALSQNSSSILTLLSFNTGLPDNCG